MTDHLRRFRGPGIALVVLAMSAGVVFAGAPGFSPSADTETVETTTTDTTDETTTVETTTVETTTVETTTVETTTTETTTGTEDGSEDNHGALVSAAAQMPTPDGFANHGAFVSCVAKMGKDVVATGFDWTTVTPESCGQAADDPTTEDPTATTERGKGEGAARSQAGKVKAEAGKAKGKGRSGR